jgi:AbrB family looped-hinge helix DNA binding protein
LPYFDVFERKASNMGTLTVTAKGQVTLRKDILRHLGIRPGGQVEVDVLPGGRVEFRAAKRTGKISDLAGMLHREGGPVLTIDEIKESIAAGWAGEP